MISRLTAIAVLFVRDMVRSRLLISLFLVLALAVVGLPLAIRGDGTPEGTVKILIHYTLGFAAIILGVATLWAACGGISREIEDRHVRLIAVKPVRKGELWLGKWLGLVGMNGLLLLTCGVWTYGHLMWRLHATALTGVQRDALRHHTLTGRRRIQPLPEDVRGEAEQRVDERLQQGGQLPDGVSRGQAIDALARQIRLERAVVPAGGERTWRLALPPREPRGRGSASLRLHREAPWGDVRPVAGTWEFLGDEGVVLHRVVLTNETQAAFVDLPADVLPPGSKVHVRFSHARDSLSESIVFDPVNPVELLLPEASFESNLLRCLLILLSRLAVLAALGLAAGSLFSFPVATFCASGLVCMVLISNAVAVGGTEAYGEGHHHGAVEKPSVIENAGEQVMRLTRRAVAPLLRSAPLSLLSDGVLVTGRETAIALAALAGYTAVFGALAAFHLSRRELALTR